MGFVGGRYGRLWCLAHDEAIPALRVKIERLLSIENRTESGSPGVLKRDEGVRRKRWEAAMDARRH